MYLSEELEELIYIHNGIYDDKFKSELYEILDKVVSEDTSDGSQIIEKLRLTWNLVCGRHADLSDSILSEYIAFRPNLAMELKSKNIVSDIIEPKSITVKVKKLYEDSKLPTRAHESDGGMDMYAHSIKLLLKKGIISYGLGVALELPAFHSGYLFPRSGIYNTGLDLSNSVGLVDSGYRGEVTVKFRVTFLGFVKFLLSKIFKKSFEDNIYRIGDRCCQLVVLPYPKVILESVTELSTSDRGSNGFGSTGKK